MQNNHIARIVERAKIEKEVNEYEIAYRREYIDIVIKYLRKVIKENPGVTKEKLRIKILNDMYDELKEYCDIANVRGRYFQIEAARKIINNKDLVSKEYEIALINENKSSGIYTAKLEQACKELILQTLENIKNTEKEIEPDLLEIVNEYNNSDNKEKRKIEQRFKNKASLFKFKRLARSFNGTYPDRIYAKITDDIVDYEKQLKSLQIEVMELMAKKFNSYDLLQKYKRNNDGKMLNNGLSEYTYDLSTKQYNKDGIGIKELFSKEFLETQDLEDVMTLSLFWQNRYSKECKSIGEAVFSIDTLNLWDKIIKRRFRN